MLLRDDDWIKVWDYKAGQRLDETELEDYETQLYIYATLYREPNDGDLPDRSVIYFLGEETRNEAQFVIDFEGSETRDRYRLPGRVSSFLRGGYEALFINMACDRTLCLINRSCNFTN